MINILPTLENCSPTVSRSCFFNMRTFGSASWNFTTDIPASIYRSHIFSSLTSTWPDIFWKRRMMFNGKPKLLANSFFHSSFPFSVSYFKTWLEQIALISRFLVSTEYEYLKMRLNKSSRCSFGRGRASQRQYFWCSLSYVNQSIFKHFQPDLNGSNPHSYKPWVRPDLKWFNITHRWLKHSGGHISLHFRSVFAKFVMICSKQTFPK